MAGRPSTVCYTITSGRDVSNGDPQPPYRCNYPIGGQWIQVWKRSNAPSFADITLFRVTFQVYTASQRIMIIAEK